MTNPSDETTIPFPEEPGGGRTAPEPDLHRPGDEIGPYKLVSVLGEGGLGSVWLAERRRPFVQRVALKLIKAGMDTKQVLARFEQERQALALMNHPCIAKVLDGGMTNSGRPYFVMEYVQGDPITEFCDARKLGIRERLVLFERACDAIQHAHLKGVIHRDITPRNILAFAGPGGEPGLKVIDFGLAKAMGQGLTAQTMVTEIGQMVGTADYMSPEQADPTGSGVDTRTDIYSLGVLLYELMSGAKPFDLANRARQEIQQIIQHEDPPAPSVRLSSQSTKDAAAASRIEKARAMRIAEIVRTLRTELEWIPLKAMRKEPQHRYQSAMALAEDVRNYLEGRPLVAAPEAGLYRLRKFVRRNRGAVTACAAVTAATALGLTASLWLWRLAGAAEARAEAARSEAQRAEAVAQREQDEARHARGLAEESAREAAALRNEAEDLRMQAEEVQRRTRATAATAEVVDMISRALSDDPERRAMAAPAVDGPENIDGFITGLPSALVAAQRGRPVGIVARGEFQQVEAMATHQRSSSVAITDGERIGLQVGTSDPRWLAAGTDPGVRVLQLAFSGDGKTLFAADDRGTVHAWACPDGEPIGSTESIPQDSVPTRLAAATRPDGRTIVAAGFEGGEVRIWDGARLRDAPVTCVGHRAWIEAIALSPDGAIVASLALDGDLRFWSTATGGDAGPAQRAPGVQFKDIQFHPSGTRLAITGVHGFAEIALKNVGGEIRWRAEELRFYAMPDELVVRLSYDMEGEAIAAGTESGGVQLFGTVPSVSEAVAPMQGAATPLASAIHAHDSELLGVGLLGQEMAVVSADRSSAVLNSLDAERRWRLWSQVTLPGSATDVAECDEGDSLAVATTLGWIWIADIASDRPVGMPLRSRPTAIEELVASTDGQRLVARHADGAVEVWDVAERRVIGGEPVPVDGATTCIAISGDGTKVLIGGSRTIDGELKGFAARFDCTGTGISSTWSATLAGEPRSIAFGPGEATVLVLDDQAGVHELDAEAGATSSSDILPVHAPTGLWLSPSGDKVAYIGLDAELGELPKLCRLRGSTPYEEMVLLSIGGNRSGDVWRNVIELIRFSPTGRTVASRSADGGWAVWSGDCGLRCLDNGALASVRNSTWNWDARRIHTAPNDVLRFSGSGRRLFIGEAETGAAPTSVTLVLDSALASRSVLPAQFRAPSLTAPPGMAAQLPDGRRLEAPDYDTAQSRLIAEHPAHPAEVRPALMDLGTRFRERCIDAMLELGKLESTLKDVRSTHVRDREIMAYGNAPLDEAALARLHAMTAARAMDERLGELSELALDLMDADQLNDLATAGVTRIASGFGNIDPKRVIGWARRAYLLTGGKRRLDRTTLVRALEAIGDFEGARRIRREGE